MWVLAAVKSRRTCCLQPRVELRHGTESWHLLTSGVGRGTETEGRRYDGADGTAQDRTG